MAEPEPASAEKPAVVLVHGWWDTMSKFKKMMRRLERLGFTCYAPTLKPSDARHGIEPLAEDLKNFIQNEIPAEKTLALVGFSMGGIISRYYLQKLGGADRTSTLCTLATPIQGTYFGYCWPSLGAKQMRPGSDFLESLDASESTLDGVSVEAWWTPLDLMIVPPTNATWPGRKSHMVVVVAHPLMVFDDRVISEVAKALGA